MSNPKHLAGERGEFLFFRTESGREYACDDASGAVLPVEPPFPEGPAAPEAQELEARFQLFRQGALTRVLPLLPWTPERVINEASMAPGLQLTLVLTERCSLRCRYCVHTGTYDYLRTHSETDMPDEVALAAVDLLADLDEVRQERNPGRVPTIAFYGGEPLLRFDLIRKVVDYASRRGHRFDYALTTNGTVWDAETVDYLVVRRFNIAVSLDGPPSEHDRNRVFPDGSGSFDRTKAFLEAVLSARRRVGRGLRPLPYYVLSCADRGTDLGAVAAFFEAHPELFGATTGRATMIWPYRTCYYDGWKAEDLARSRDAVGALWRRYRAGLISGKGIGEQGFADWLLGPALWGTLLSLSQDPSPWRGCCIPGARCAVDARGRLHICERVNGNYAIGTVERGLDYAYLCDLLNAAQEYFAGHCSSCAAKRFCGACFSHVLVDGGLRLEVPPEYCGDVPSMTQVLLGRLYSLFELDPECESRLVPSLEEARRDHVFNA